MQFPIDLNHYKPLKFDITQSRLTAEQHDQLRANIQLARDAIVFFTAYASVKGLGGHTGGAYDIAPEMLTVDGFMRGSQTLLPIYYDEAGHRVAIQYLLAVLNGFQSAESLLHYREFGGGAYGHPERDDDKGIFFSSGRLGHLWSHVNGVAVAHPDKIVILFGSDGSQQEGGDAEAARFAVSHHLNIKLLIDDNNVTIAGHPSDYMRGFDLARTLKGHGLAVDTGQGEDLGALFERIRNALTFNGPVALINQRPMAPGIDGLEGSCRAHDVIPVSTAVDYLLTRGHTQAVEMLKSESSGTVGQMFRGSTVEMHKCRDAFGKIICDIVEGMTDLKSKVRVVDSDLEGSCGLHHIRRKHPEIYVHGGIMERNNFSVAAGFGSAPGRQGIFATFSAFLEMVISETTMARLNRANVLAHFSHAGVDEMADNTCHFGINNFYADNGLQESDNTRLYFPADVFQMRAVLERVFHDQGLRFVFSTRSATPIIETSDGKPFYGDGYKFVPGRDEIIRQGTEGYVVSYGEMLCRCLDAVEKLNEEGINVGLINKPTLNVVDEEIIRLIGKSKFVLVVETQNAKTGLGIRCGSWLLERRYAPRYGYMGVTKEGRGGLGEQILQQELCSESICKKILELIASTSQTPNDEHLK